jgi:hypothetical protein
LPSPAVQLLVTNITTDLGIDDDQAVVRRMRRKREKEKEKEKKRRSREEKGEERMVGGIGTCTSWINKMYCEKTY